MSERVVVAMMKHETNTFSPVPTDLARFAREGEVPWEGDAARRAYQGTGTAFAAFVDLADVREADIVIPIAANAPPSGPVHDAAYEYMCERILRAVREGCDALLLDLHGAMVTESLTDGEGELLARIRDIAPEVPLAVALDMHANLSEAIVRNADAIAGYQTYPHVDVYETGLRAGRPVLAMLDGAPRPHMVWGRRPMLPHVMRQGTDDHPNRALQARARAMESESPEGRALAASLFTGFPHADIPEAGLSAVVVSGVEADPEGTLARRCLDELLDTAWDEREAFVYRIEPLEESVARARALGTETGGAGSGEGEKGPIILLDHYDNAASGGTMDTMTVIGAVLDAGLEDVAVFAVYDPDAVAEMARAGVGAELTLSLGGHLDMPAIGLRGQPREVTGRVRLLSDGRFRNRGPMQRGVPMNMGPCAVLETAPGGRRAGKGVEIVVISRHQEPNDLGVFLTLGIDPARRRYLVLKSRIHYRAAFGPLARTVIECAGSGVCTSDYAALRFERVRRPIFPLDRINEP